MPGREIKRCVFFLNGRSEWIEKYPFLPEKLELPDDTAFLTYDHRGQGGSGGIPAHIKSYEVYAQDAKRLLLEVVGEVPYVILAHSMGALISLTAIRLGLLKPQSLVMSSPLLLMRQRPVPRWVAKPVGYLSCNAGMGMRRLKIDLYHTFPFENNGLTHSKEGFDRIRQMPYPAIGPSFRWVHESFKAMRATYSRTFLRDFDIPTLVMGSPRDRILDPRGFKLWTRATNRFAKVPARLELFPEAFHELFNEVPVFLDPVMKRFSVANDSW